MLVLMCGVYRFKGNYVRKLGGRMSDCQSLEPLFDLPLLPFQNLGIFVLPTTPQFIQLYGLVLGYGQSWKYVTE